LRKKAPWKEREEKRKAGVMSGIISIQPPIRRKKPAGAADCVFLAVHLYAID